MTLTGNNTKRVPLPVRAGAAYAPNVQARIDFGDVPGMAPGLEPYAEGIEIACDVVFTHDGGAPINLAELAAHKVIEEVTLRLPNGHVFYDLPAQAGVLLYQLHHGLFGRRPPCHGGGGAVALPNGANTTVRVKFYLPFQAPHGINPQDWNLALRDLRAAQLTIRWANGAAGGVFNDGANNPRIVSATMRASIDLVGRADQATPGAGEWRYAPRWTFGTMLLSSVEEQVPLKGRVLHALFEVRTQADGIANTPFALADRSLVTLLTADGVTVVDREDARDLVTRWNRHFAAARAEELAEHDAGSNTFLPLFVPLSRPAKVTQLPALTEHPTLRVTGAVTTPRILYATSELTTIADVQTAIRDGDVPRPPEFAANPEAFLDAKTASKSTAAPGIAAFRRLPVRLHKRPVTG